MTQPDNTIDGEEQGDSKSPQLGEQPEQVKSLTEVMASLELPWPKDVFGVVPKEDWAKINEWAKKELGYPLDRISGDLMRHGWKCYERLLRERVNDLVSYGVVVTTDPSNPQKIAQEANKAEIRGASKAAEVINKEIGVEMTTNGEYYVNNSRLTADKEPHIAFPTAKDIGPTFKASKFKKSGLGRRYNGKHDD